MKKLYLVLIYLLTFIFLHPSHLIAQAPTNQDCGGAIPICHNVYSQSNSYSGTGNIDNEVNTGSSCTDGEINSVWYTFTAQTTGNFSFIISPNNTSGSGDDYDWTVFNLTNATCADIYNNSALEISCNSWGDAYGYNGQTGASTAMGGSGNHNGPGTDNGPEFNQDIPVTAGNIYVMMVSNWTGSTYGYTVDFSSSTAQIFDNVPPHIQSIISSIPCGGNTITFQFSESILCSTIASCDLTLTGPGGPYTITSLTGANCAAGGTEERTFTITVSPAITTSGTYNLNLVASNCGSVTDLCGNVAPSGSLPFTITNITTNISAVNSSCGLNNGSATVSASGGNGSYTYLWNTVPAQTTATASNIHSGNYTVTVTSGACNAIANVTVNNIGGPTVTTSATNASCGNSNGTATATATGGSGTYTYHWSCTPVQTTQTASNLPPGNYTVTVNDGACNATANITVGNNPPPTLTTSSTAGTCGNSNGTATVTATGGSGNYSYSWSTTPAQTTATATALAAGTYTVTVNDGFCTVTSTVNVTVNTAPTSGITNTVNPTCGNSNGSVTVTATLGSGTYTYTWNTTPVQTTAIASNLPAGTYTVTVSDGGCTCMSSATINNIGGPTVTTTSTNASCGNNNGTATVTPTGGSGTYTYSWNSTPVQTTQTASNLAPGNYSVTVNDGTCTAIGNVTVGDNPAPTLSTTTTVGTCGNPNATATVTATGGSGNYTYTWSTTPVQNTTTATALAAGTYTISVNDGFCNVTSTVNVTVNPAPTSTITNSSDPTCGNSNGSITVTAASGSGTYSYSWNTTPAQTTAIASNIPAGIYTCTISDGSCTCLSSAILNNIGGPTVTTTSTNANCGNSNGSATVTATGGSGTYTYTWDSTPAQTTQTASNLTPGTYNVTVNDGTCSAFGNVTVGDNPAPVLTTTFTNENCGHANGTATVTATGGTGNYTYTWSIVPVQTTTTATNLPGGTYTVTVNDGNCTVTAIVTITNLAGPSASINNVVNTVCSQSNGSAIVTANGGTPGYTYLWNSFPQQTTANLQNVAAGTYSVTVTDNVGCIATNTVTITDSPGPTAQITNVVSATCGQYDGSITATITGGTAPVVCAWNTTPVQTTPALTAVPGGYYCVTVTDGNGCTATASSTINTTNNPSAVISTTPDYCNQSNGTATVTVVGGGGPCTFLWNNGLATQTITGLAPGAYSVTVSDGPCSATANGSVNSVAGPTAGFSYSPNVLTSMEGPVSFLDNSSGNIVNWLWNYGDGSPLGAGSSSTHIYSGLGTFVVTLVITDNNGCTDTTTDTVRVKDIFTFYVPNGFTPNGDGINDFFTPRGISVDPNNFDEYIFDRWGNVFFHTNIWRDTYAEPWNGTKNNNGSASDVVPDVYVYKIKVKEIGGNKHEYFGRITLVP